MRIIAFINDAGTVKKILDHIGESTPPSARATAVGSGQADEISRTYSADPDLNDDAFVAANRKRWLG